MEEFERNTYPTEIWEILDDNQEAVVTVGVSIMRIMRYYLYMM
jgi:hypothetical protein